MSDSRRREIGDRDDPVEDELAESFDKTVSEGAERLHRTWRVTLITGFFGGLEVGLGVLAYLAVSRSVSVSSPCCSHTVNCSPRTF
jgi:hypothetical protein